MQKTKENVPLSPVVTTSVGELPTAVTTIAVVVKTEEVEPWFVARETSGRLQQRQDNRHELDFDCCLVWWNYAYRQRKER